MSEKANNSTSTWLDLSDEAFMLALCVRPENLQDPARWCNEMRSHALAMKVGPTSVHDSEQTYLGKENPFVNHKDVAERHQARLALG